MTDHVLSEKNNPFGLSQSDLRRLGLEEVGYIKKYDIKGKPAWVLHAADGTALAVQGNPDAAVLSAQYKELDVVSVH